MNSYLRQQRTFWWNNFFSLMKKTATPFHQSMRFTSNKLWWVNLRVQLFVASKYRLRLNGRKIVKSIKGSFTQGFSFEEYGLKQISAHICGCGRGFVEAFSFLALKKMAHHFTRQLYVSHHIPHFQQKKKNMFWVFKNILAQISVISNHMGLGRTPASAKLLQQVCTSVNGRLWLENKTIS